MKQLLIEIDDDTAEQLEKVAPVRSRRRSEFIRTAIRRALWDLEERRTRDAYTHVPDSAAEAFLDPAAWEPVRPRAPWRRRARR